MHPTAEAGFGSEADRYERSRPGYPAEAVTHLVELADGLVLDLGAGTGKLTRDLVDAGLDVVAAEPVEGMRSHLRRHSTRVVGAVAEALPFADGVFSLVTVGQAWHWFDGRAASAEVDRVVDAGGALASIWNTRTRDEEWTDRLWSMMDEIERDAPWRTRGSQQDNQPGEPWREVDRRAYDNVVETTPDVMVDRMASASHVGALPEGDKDAFLEEVRRVVEEVEGPLRVRYRTELVVFRR